MKEIIKFSLLWMLAFTIFMVVVLDMIYQLVTIKVTISMLIIFPLLFLYGWYHDTKVLKNKIRNLQKEKE